MKKTIIIVILACMGLSALHADPEAFSRARNLIDRGLGANFDLILDTSRYLTPAEKDRLYDRFNAGGSNKSLLGMGVNFLVGFGVGSYVIGDVQSGVLATILDLTGGAAFWIGYLGGSIFSYSIDGGASSSVFIVLGVLGAIVRLGSFVHQMISPFNYVRNYDEMLSDALRISALDLEIRPYLAGSGSGGAELGLHLAI